MDISAIAKALGESIVGGDGTYTEGFNDGIETAARIIAVELAKTYPGFSPELFLVEVGINP